MPSFLEITLIAISAMMAGFGVALIVTLLRRNMHDNLLGDIPARRPVPARHRRRTDMASRNMPGHGGN